MLVGDVRWATTGSGSSWKLSGGSAWSSGPTNVSKNRHVRRAMRRSAPASAAESWLRGRLGRRQADPAGDERRQQPQRRRTAAAIQAAPGFSDEDEHGGDRGERDAAAICR